MKVTFECEKCGAVLSTLTGIDYAEDIGVVRDTTENLIHKCPKCNPPEPTYGPITVEMVAGMLYSAHIKEGVHLAWDALSYAVTGEGERRSFMRQARAVIRLLTMLRPTPHFELSERSGVDWHNKLMDIAKESK